MELTRENYNETAKELLAFLQNSPSCFHAVKECNRYAYSSRLYRSKRGRKLGA